MKTVICKVKPGYTIEQVAAEIKTAFGIGGNPYAPILEEYVGWVNTAPTSAGYFRAAFDEAYAAACQYIADNGGAETVELIKIELDGQEMFQVGEYLDQDGVLQPEYLAFIAGCPMKQVEVVE